LRRKGVHHTLTSRNNTRLRHTMRRAVLVLVSHLSSKPLLPLWRPRFLISFIHANDRINRVKPTDVGQTMVDLGHHLEILAKDH
jgi:hypothetical protein